MGNNILTILELTSFSLPSPRKDIFAPYLTNSFFMQKQTKTINYYLALWLPRPLSID